MRYNYNVMINIINDNITDVTDLVNMLEISIEDIVARFPDKLKENFYKFAGEFPDQPEEQEPDEESYDEEN